MSASSVRLPYLQTDGLSQAGRRVAIATRDGDDLAVLLVRILDVERLCASIGHQRVAVMLDDLHAQLQTIARENDAIERLGDRKFALMLSGLRNRGHVSLAAQKVERLVREIGSRHKAHTDVRTSIGVSLCPLHGNDAGELLRLAEIGSLDGMRKREAVCFYEKQSAHQLFDDWSLENRLANALQAGDLDLHFQPKICLQSNQVSGAEALMRWHEPEIGQISPEVFINLAESTGQIVDLTHFAIQRACRQLSEWRKFMPDLNIAVNITPSIIGNCEIVEVLKSAASIWNVPPQALTMEVTENALMEDRETSHEVLTLIRRFGASVSIDDFGTGYSSLAYLKEIPADELKIDRTFVMGMLTDPGDYKIVEHSIRIAKSFGLRVVAEGVECGEMLDELRQLGCDYVQGFHICKPVDAQAFEAFCRDWSR